MGTMATIVILFAIIFIGKFIYDTYLTNNTERDFEEYRKNDPIGAAEIELPKTPEQFAELVSAVNSELYNTPKKISELFPDFIRNDSGIKVIVDSEQKLEVESSNGTIKVFLQIERKLEDGNYYFGMVVMDADFQFYNSETILLGSRAKVVANPPNWDLLTNVALADVDIKRSREKYTQLITDAQRKLPLLFDGFYCITNIDGTGSTLVLKFYPDGIVIHVRLDGDPYLITSWFKRDNEKVMKGNYHLTDGILDFRVSSQAMGSTYFVGYVKTERQLFLTVNGSHETRFGFHAVDENKTYKPSPQQHTQEDDFDADEFYPEYDSEDVPDI